MKSTSFKLIFPVALTAISLVQPMLAANDRSWVSHNGSDANACTSSSPCKTLQHAHDMTNPGGEVDALDPGEYGTLIINKPITIDGGSMAYIEVPASTAGVFVNADRLTTVILRNLKINGMSAAGKNPENTAIYWGAGGTLFIENVDIAETNSGFAMDRTLVNPQLYVKNTTVHVLKNTDSNGFSLGGGNVDSGKVTADFDRVTVEGATFGIIFTLARVNITRSMVADCEEGVMSLAGSEANVSDSELVSNNLALNVGGTAADAGLIRIAGNRIHDNSRGMWGFGKVVSFGNNAIAGNFDLTSETPNSTVALK